jgi:hypothetical protein
MADALFIRPNDTRLLSYVESNYDNDQVSVLIYDTQQMEILPLLGTGLYNELSTQITLNTLTNLNTTLLNLLRPAVRMNVLAYGMLVFNYKIRNKGIQTMNSDNSQSVGLDVVDRMTQNFKDQAQVYNERVHNYLMANTSLYPLFLNAGSTSDTIHAKTNQYYTGWVMGDGEDCSCTLDNPSV